ncbi:hypothetical protein [Vreelandella utahensis]|uniref:hypothetical protein n=1 Tax=Vreelandella halophila TaxID=86177 RepID=UPI00117A4F48|nr:hypothetical protein [Halomonas utahensis]
MESIDFIYKIRVAKFFQWVSGGTAAAALGLFIFTVGLPTDQTQKWVALSLFSFSMPMLLGASAISKDIQIFEATSSKSDRLHSMMLTVGVLSFMAGFGILCFLINSWLPIIIGISFSISVLLYSYSYDSLVAETSSQKLRT